ncbi:hypothetical protein Ndes2437A_g00111 [Nannochloris sp. 'desiccata']
MIQARNNKWIELKLLADASSPTTLDPKLLQKSPRLFIDPNDKQACTRLGRNTLGVKLYAAGVEELQIATLQGWDVGSKMQRHYLSKDPAAVLPAMLQGAGFPANSPRQEQAAARGAGSGCRSRIFDHGEGAHGYLAEEPALLFCNGAVLKDAPAEHGVVDGGGLGNVFFDVAVYIVETILGRGVPVDFKVVQDAGQDALEGCLVSLARSIVLKVPLAEQDDHGIRKLII